MKALQRGKKAKMTDLGRCFLSLFKTGTLMNRTFTVFALLVCLTACGANTDSGNPTGGRTNWLSHCDEDRDCAELPNALCVDQKCTKLCAEDAECAGLGVDAECGEAANESDGSEHVCVATSDSEGNCDAAVCVGDETQFDTDVTESDVEVTDPEVTDSNVTGSETTDSETTGSVESQASGTELDSNATSSEASTFEEETQTELDPASCVSPTSNVEQAYECSLEPCECNTRSSEIVCTTGADGIRYALQCNGGFWLPMENSRCATDTSRCFSPTENVDLALSGTLPGCECSPDDFTCAVQGDLRVPMQCGTDDRWKAMPDGADCQGLFMDLCATSELPPACDSGDCTQEEPLTICDGSDEIRLFRSSGGFFVSELHPFYAYGYSFLAIDGHCNYWAGIPRHLGLVRSGVLDAERARQIQPEIYFGELDTFADYEPVVCDGSGGSVLRDPFGQIACSCGCDYEGAPGGFLEAFSAAFEFGNELFAEGAEVTGPAQLLIIEDEALELWGPGMPWQLAFNPLANLFDYDGDPAITPELGRLVTSASELEALRAMRQNWFSTDEYAAHGTHAIHATYEAGSDAGALTHLHVLLRDELPDLVRAEFGLPISNP
jgi:hypothetical protein